MARAKTDRLGKLANQLKSLGVTKWAKKTAPSAANMYGDAKRRPSGFHVAIRLKYSHAVGQVWARKKIQPTNTTLKVKKRAKMFQIGGKYRFVFKPASGSQCFQIRWVARAQPCSPPQNTKFQLAPCHNPHNNMVASRLK